jgi:hypothetical protein
MDAVHCVVRRKVCSSSVAYVAMIELWYVNMNLSSKGHTEAKFWETVCWSTGKS